ncbi:MAG: Ig-like domain-containing protein [Candidatus Eiseniibacteriota bacterium]|nr:MAG: Ig-like domain-containing protein [Candidatus Eisenbacteria bacterium]
MRPVLLLCMLIALASCARKGLPPGGPPDVTPPVVLSSTPDSGAVGVARVNEICLRFSERMEKRTVRDAVVVRPRVQIKEERWHKNTFCLVLSDSLKPEVTYSLLVMGGCKDSHGNNMKSPHVSVFATADTLMAGTISGSVLSKGVPVSGIPVWAFDSLTCPEPDFTKDEPHYVSQSGAGGDFKFLGLPSGTYMLFVFKDKDANRAYDEETDFTSPAPEPVRITPEATEVANVEIALVDPREPGKIAGRVEHCLPDTVRVIVYATSTTDSLASYSAPAMSDSTFSVAGPPPGRYSVSCYADFNLNQTHDTPDEPGCSEVHFVQVFPGETTKDVVLVIPCEREPGEEGESVTEPETGEAPKLEEPESRTEGAEGPGQETESQGEGTEGQDETTESKETEEQ